MQRLFLFASARGDDTAAKHPDKASAKYVGPAAKRAFWRMYHNVSASDTYCDLRDEAAAAPTPAPPAVAMSAGKSESAANAAVKTTPSAAAATQRPRRAPARRWSSVRPRGWRPSCPARGRRTRGTA